MLTTSACSKHTPSDSSTSESATASENASSEGETPSAPANFDCTKVFSATDTAGVMAPPLKVSAVAMSPGMCELKSPDGSTIQISVDDDRDRALWDDPNQRAIGKYQPVSGLGDEAFAVTSDDGTQLYVKKGSHYCGIIAGIEKVPVKGDALARQVGALCSKVIAAL
jgi:hypothetical protein